jgi:hypothetical protein
MPTGLELIVERESVEPGLTFSEDAILGVGQTLVQWLLHELKTQWDHTGVPPTRMVITCDLEVQ